MQRTAIIFRRHHAASAPQRPIRREKDPDAVRRLNADPTRRLNADPTRRLKA